MNDALRLDNGSGGRMTSGLHSHSEPCEGHFEGSGRLSFESMVAHTW
jgi:hypothetical protein